MSEFSNLSRAALVAELMAPIGTVSETIEPYCTQPPASDVQITRRLAIAREILLRDLEAQFSRTSVLGTPAKVREYLILHYAHVPHELFGALFLDAQNRLVSAEHAMFRGTLTQTSVYPREVVKAALACNAAATVLCHCHPSGLPEPSRADELLTQSLKHALALVDVKVLDHFIVAGMATPVSFSERGLL